MKKQFLFIACFFITSLFANEYRAYGIAGDLESSKSQVIIEGEVYTLLPFSSENLEIDEINKDGEYRVLVGEVNGQKIPPIKLASNYKNQNLVVKAFKGTSKFDEATLVIQSEDIFTDDSYEFFYITIH